MNEATVLYLSEEERLILAAALFAADIEFRRMGEARTGLFRQEGAVGTNLPDKSSLKLDTILSVAGMTHQAVGMFLWMKDTMFRPSLDNSLLVADKYRQRDIVDYALAEIDFETVAGIAVILEELCPIL